MTRGTIAAREKELVALEGVTLRAGERPVFKGTNWTIRAGEQWAIIGPNGSGKSLLAAAVAGRAPLVGGEIRHHFDPGVPGSGASGAEPVIPLVSPGLHREVMAGESSFYQSRWHSGLGEGRMTAGEYLSREHLEEINPFEVGPRRRARGAFPKERKRWVGRLGLMPLLSRKLLQLSNGEMRKVLLAGALLRSPDLLVLDEPFAGLDTATRGILKAVLRELMEGGMPVLLATSRLDEVPSETTHLLLVRNYRVAMQGTKTAVRRHSLMAQLKGKKGSTAAGAVARLGGNAAAAGKFAPLVEMRNVTIRFGRKPVLREINWTLRGGEHWAVLGPNGSGKSTLLSLIQVDNPQAYAQDLRLFGVSPESTQALWRARRRLGWFSPELHLHYPRAWSCLEVVCSGLADTIGLHQRPNARQRRVAQQWLEKFRLARFAESRFGALSSSDQRLVLLARAMVKNPRLVILDEPCQGLDSAHRRLVLEAVDRSMGDAGVSLIFVTHHRREMPRCISHVLQLKEGRVVRQGRRAQAGARQGSERWETQVAKSR